MDTDRTRYVPALKYSWLTTSYDLLIRVTMPETQFKTALINQANIQEAHRVLDFGTGTATLLLLAKQLVPRAEIMGVDIDEKIIGIAREKIKSANVSIKIDKYDGIRLPYPDDHFDSVLSSLVFCNLTKEQKGACLRELGRVLKTHGELHVADWGRAQNALMRFLFLFVQILDGFKTTTDNVRGLLPGYMKDAGFVAVEETKTFSTAFGTLSLYQATKRHYRF